MRIPPAIRSFTIEVALVAVIAYLFSLFAHSFTLWASIMLVMVLVWHHFLETKLLRQLNPKDNKINKLSRLEKLSQTIAYDKNHDRREKFKSLRILSRLNKNIQSLSDSMIICDLAGNISWCNQSAQKLFDFYWQKKAEKNVLNVIFYPEFKQYFQKENHSKPLVLVTHNQRYVEIHISLYDNATYLILARDISQFVRILNSRQTFLSNLNHELRTPLTVLRGYLEFLQPEENNTVQQQAIQAMKEQTERMSTLLQQLNILAKIEGSDNKNHQAVNLSEVILSLQKNTDLLTDKQTVEFNITPDLYVWGDESQLQSATSNLIYNAIKHAGEHAHIRVDWQPCPEGAKFSVSDNGVGIDEKHLPHLTERFYRVDESRSNQTGGSGLGLAIVKHSLSQHNSHLDITSKAGEGSCFSFILPVVMP
ncbi:phosphate regulon sensor histidine kinase PhoR [Pasteurellaceae bacterium LIM206]|nr:phosphate regulon sensor histidine kinase PhoR [Pasteurellaceae bacterium LIM206]